MTIPLPTPADVLILGKMNQNVLDTIPSAKILNPGENPWTKYIIVGSAIILSGVIAYYIFLPTKSKLKPNSYLSKLTQDEQR